MFTRRSIAGLFAAAPFAGKAVADQAVESLGNPKPPSAGPYSGGSEQARPQPPRMDHKAALRFILNDAAAMDEVRAELAAAELRSNPYIDPDIQIMKSFSPMAKIAFQRQRNIERGLADVFESGPDRPNRYVRAIEARLRKLMWGE